MRTIQKTLFIASFLISSLSFAQQPLESMGIKCTAKGVKIEGVTKSKVEVILHTSETNEPYAAFVYSPRVNEWELYFPKTISPVPKQEIKTYLQKLCLDSIQREERKEVTSVSKFQFFLTSTDHPNGIELKL